MERGSAFARTIALTTRIDQIEITQRSDAQRSDAQRSDAQRSDARFDHTAL